MSSSLRVIKGVIHLCSSHAESQRMPILAPNPLVQACSALVKSRVFSCLTTQKSLQLEASIISMKSGGQRPLSQGGASYQPEASC